MPFPLFIAIISGLAGFLGGLTGTGGIIMPPLMTGIYAVPPHLATGMAQASYFIPSLLASLLFLRRGQLDWRVAMPMSLSGLAATFASAAWLKPLLANSSLNIFFALCILISGLAMLGRSSWRLDSPLSPPWRAPILFLLGALVGLMAGITGSGGNAVLVPAMTFLGLEILVVMAACQFFSCLAAFFGFIGNSLNMEIDLAIIACMVATQMLGIWLGVGLAQRMDTTRLKRAVGLVCLLAGIFMIARELS
ncbi:MAG: sulfite exporter TauE/SafE family protein [Planctomycetota bacterium]|nr:sulfite exporter TauE/SafE family protein [Planctomycetota bacterium]